MFGEVLHFVLGVRPFGPEVACLYSQTHRNKRERENIYMGKYQEEVRRSAHKRLSVSWTHNNNVDEAFLFFQRTNQYTVHNWIGVDSCSWQRVAAVLFTRHVLRAIQKSCWALDYAQGLGFQVHQTFGIPMWDQRSESTTSLTTTVDSYYPIHTQESLEELVICHPLIHSRTAMQFKAILLFYGKDILMRAIVILRRRKSASTCSV